MSLPREPLSAEFWFPALHPQPPHGELRLHPDSGSCHFHSLFCDRLPGSPKNWQVIGLLHFIKPQNGAFFVGNPFQRAKTD